MMRNPFAVLPRGVRRLFGLPLTRERLARDADEEMQFHIAMWTAEFIAAGMSEAEARAAAQARFGSSEEYRAYIERRAARKARIERFIGWFVDWMQDLHFAARQFRKALGFTMIAVLTLALGIGANTAIFTVVRRLLIAPLPYRDGNRLVRLVITADNGPAPDAKRRLLHLVLTRSRSLETIAAVEVDALYLQQYAGPDTIDAYVTANYLGLFSLRPALGRALTMNDERPGAPPVAMISYHRWQDAYAGRSDVLGRTVKVYDRIYSIVGVTPPELSIPMTLAVGASANLRQPLPAIWLPTPLDLLRDGVLFAKLRPGISAAQASHELEAITASDPTLAQSRLQARAMRAQDLLDPRESRAVEILFAAVGVLLLIACANVANLLMSRAWTRRREFAVRIALGAACWRLVRLLLTESVLLAVVGGVLGVGVAWWTLRAVIALRPPSLENLAATHMDLAVLAWSASLSVLTGILFGCAPLLLASSRAVGGVLRNDTRSGSEGSLARRMRSSLMVLEVALCVVLLLGAGLLVRSFIALEEMPLGFDPHGLVSADIMLLLPREHRVERGTALRSSILARVRALPGVAEVVIGVMPSQEWTSEDRLETDPDASGQMLSVPEFAVTFISPNFFQTARMALVEGRFPDSTTWPRTLADSGASQEVVVNEGLARRFWPDGRVVGARMHVGGVRGRLTKYVVSGVVAEARLPGPRAAVKAAAVYQPLPPQLAGQVPILLRTTLPSAQIASSIRRAVASVESTSIVRAVNIGDDLLRDSLAPTRFAMALLGAFAATALLLAVAGLYAVIAYSVGQRTREIGVRVALGADPGAIARLVLGGGFRLAAAGIAIGAAAAVGASRALTSMLYGVTSSDPLTFAAISLLVAGVAILATYLPARRASLIDPTEALRAE